MYQKLLVPLDGSELAECAIPHMVAIARGCNVVDVVLLRVIEQIHLPGEYVISENDRERMEARHRADAEKYLEALAERLTREGISVELEIISGKVADSIVEYAEERDVDLIVMATHGRSGISRWSLGSVADRVIHHSCVPVLMVRAPGCVVGT